MNQIYEGKIKRMTIPLVRASNQNLPNNPLSVNKVDTNEEYDEDYHDYRDRVIEKEP
jgi:hypothetical protein